MIEITNENFEEEVIESDKPVLVDFWASCCMPCKMLGPILDELSEELTEVKICKANVDVNQELAQKFMVQGIPTMILFKNGEEVKRIVGLRDKESLKEELTTA